ncbi:MAG: hypothetical protein ACREIB_07340 [Pseudomonadota bacterium]
MVAWLLLATHFCVDVGEAHAPVAAHAHGDADAHGTDLAHPECPVAVSADRDPGGPPMVMDLGPGSVTLGLDTPAQHLAIAPPAVAARARSAPLYLLHATLLI